MGKIKQMSHQQFVEFSDHDPKFREFVDSVSPRENGVQPVFFAELFLILKILWEVYTILKGLGFFSKWFTTMRVRAAMKVKNIDERERRLQAIVNGFAK